MSRGETFRLTNEIHRNSAPAVNVISVPFPEFREFSRAMRGFEQHLKENNREDPYWATLLRILRRYRFGLSAAPLKPDAPVLYGKESIQEIRQQMAFCDRLYPGTGAMVEDLILRIDQLASLPENPMQPRLVRMLQTPEDTEQNLAVLVCEYRYVPPVKEVVLAARRYGRYYHVITPNDLRKAYLFDRIIVVGSPRWYPSFVFDSGRSLRLSVLIFDWLYDRWEPACAFPTSSRPPGPPAFTTGGRNTGDTTDEPENTDIRPAGGEAQLVNLAVSRARQGSSNDRETEQIEMRLFLLNGEQAVFLEASETSTAMVLDLEEENLRHRVRRVKTDDIEPGMFLLLRQSGEGDYILPLADDILGKDAARLRSSQAEWKRLLCIKVEERGLHQVCETLQGLGGTRAIEINVRHWLWSRSIRPQDDADFRAVLRLIGLQTRWQSFKEDAAAVRRAHLQAGVTVRRELLAQVQKKDMRDLEAAGQIDFILSDRLGVSLAAIRVERATSIRELLPARQSGQLFDVEEGIWHT